MYAIVTIAGKQFKVTESQKIFVPLLEAEIGATVKFDDVLLLANDGSIKVGAPTIANASVTATVLEHIKDEKVIVFKKKRRKGYRVLRGHRQRFTAVEIAQIVAA